eukprot:SAG31_NODE_3826_length_3846_cov_4.431697_2_plen_93_part_00
MTLGPVGGQQAGDGIAAHIRMIIAAGDRVGVAGVHARDDSLAMGGQESAPTPGCHAAAHEETGVNLTACLAVYESNCREGGGRARRSNRRRH